MAELLPLPSYKRRTGPAIQDDRLRSEPNDDDLINALDGRKILIVDDDPTFCLMLERVLNSEGALTETAHSGNQALEMILRGSYDVVISDVLMPDGSGIDLLLALQSVTSPPPVILVSGYSAVNLQKAKQLGAIALLSKPFRIDDLVEILAQVPLR